MLFKNLFVAVALAGTALACPHPKAAAHPKAATQSQSNGKLKWFGINESGPEFGEANIPGLYNKDYIWIDTKQVDQFLAQGMNMFRINFLMERLTPNSLTANLDSNYLGNLTEAINYITSKGAYAMVQPHNYGRFGGQIISDTAAFKTWWTNVAKQYKDNSLVVFDINNEFHDMDQNLVFSLNQAGIDGIRAAGATTQYITPEGNSWSGAWTWVSSGNAASLVKLKDPQNKLVFQMHQYLDSDGSGNNADCVSSTIFQERLVAATQWLKDNKLQGVIGEFGAGSNAQCLTALQGGLDYMVKNSDVWLGAIWWSAGPWWGNYIYSMEPTTGAAWSYILPKIKSYFGH
ncbi:glycoside hydrolase family 5 protein [Bipolaris zeicola 26-R-13]|uniref:cellulase n=1 Tax=Cochliobolus carbonum (strain 26-R-13) TaxID=930089 RepID=W6YDS3_COCC2|nr:glycoside hydrolase family 5 protein [Bipolaris zeicola 26-R-13]EUC35808.1 glycoside hydrolase family 5 protein [Bipolaris zeicola 26-R-13]